MQHLIFSVVYMLVFATGAAGLIFQVTWQKYVSRLLGSDSMATAIILGSFLGGLSLGYYVCGKLSPRIRNHFKAYALLEGVVGVWCVLFPQIFQIVNALTRSWSFRPPVFIVVQGILCAALLMGVPTICMGGTIPFLTRGFSQTLGQATHVHANIYAINTIGAFVGTLLAGFYLIPVHGLPVTIMGTAFVNLAACGIVYVLSTQLPANASSASPPQDISPESPLTPAFKASVPGWIFYTITFLSGCYVMTLENVLIRILNISVGSSSYSFSLIVAVFILAIALGSSAVGRMRRISGRTLAINQLLITVGLVGIYLSLDRWPYWAHLLRVAFQANIAGFWAYYGALFLALCGILLLPVACMGATIPLVFHQLKRDLQHVGTHSGMVFSWNTLGNLTGSLLGGILLYMLFDSAHVFLIAALLAACAAVLAAYAASKILLVFPLIITGLVLIFVITIPFHRYEHFTIGTFSLREPLEYSFDGPSQFFSQYLHAKKLLFYEDDPITSVGVIEWPVVKELDVAPLSIMVNGKSDSNTVFDRYTLKMSAHLPALLSGSRKQAMVIGLGTGVTAGELSLYPEIERIDIAEISPAVIDTLPLFQDFTYHLHEDPRVHIEFGDAFRVLGRSERQWDIIISEPSNPWVTGVDMLFTQEFYRLIKAHLTPDGMLTQWIHIYAATPEMVGMALNTLQQEFRYCHGFLANPGDLMILASNRPITPERLRKAEHRLQENSRVKASLHTIHLDSLDALLLRELWSPSYIRTQFAHFGIQTMDNPRLHYIAGKHYFMDSRVPLDFLFNATTATFWSEYLLAQKYPRWQHFPFPPEQMNSLLLATQDVLTHTILPTFDALLLKAHLADSQKYPLDDARRNILQPELIQFIASDKLSEQAWDQIELQGASIREKAEVLLHHLRQTRTWIVPYAVDGLRSLLEVGMRSGQDVYEQNWCALQLAILLVSEYRDLDQARSVLQQIHTDPSGTPLLDSGDYALVLDVNRGFNQFSVLSHE